MKILIYSPVFYPSIGGLEAVVAMVADGLTRLGCCVRVVTNTHGRGDDAQFPYEIIRAPSPSNLLSQVRWCDVYFQHNISLKGLWPLAVCRRRFVVAHHGLYARNDGTLTWLASLKLLVTRFAENIAVSGVVVHQIDAECAIIPNPYQDDLFRLLPGLTRDLDLIFVGRLVSDKGADLLIDALALLKKRGVQPRLTIVGEGPEEAPLRQQVDSSDLSGQVEFLGRRSGEELVGVLNRHRLLIVPSRVREGFGIVALEGIACGCGVIASDAGGLPEAVGPCGALFQPGDVDELAGRIAALLVDRDLLASLQSKAPSHLASHSRQHVAGLYLDVLKKIAGSN